MSLRRLFRLLPSTPEVLEAWQQIVVTHGGLGKQTHDAHLVAVMQVRSVQTVLTFNISDIQAARRMHHRSLPTTINERVARVVDFFRFISLKPTTEEQRSPLTEMRTQRRYDKAVKAKTSGAASLL